MPCSRCLLPVTKIQSGRKVVEGPRCPEKFVAKGILVEEPVQVRAQRALIFACAAVF